MADIRRDLARNTLAILCILGLIGLSLWVLRPFLAATVWAVMVVVATWPLFVGLEVRLGGRRGLAVAEQLQVGQTLSFCERNPAAARRDLLRICTELRAEVEESGRRIAGALYISCAGRGGPHFGAPSAELQWLRHGLGELPLVGFFAGGEIAHRGSLYGYTGVLTAFLAD